MADPSRTDRGLPASSRDAVLVRAVVDGDVAALGRLYDGHAPALLALATRILGDRAEAEDLVHDLFVEVWQRVASYDERRSSVRTWLLVRLRSRAIDRLRSRRNRQALMSAHDSDVGSRAASAPAWAADPDRVADRRRALAGLRNVTPLQREVLELAYFEGLSQREIGVRCGVPLGTVKSRMAAAIAALRRSLSTERGRGLRSAGVRVAGPIEPGAVAPARDGRGVRD